MDFIKLHGYNSGKASLFNTLMIKEIKPYDSKMTQIVFDDDTIINVSESMSQIELMLKPAIFNIGPLYPGKITKYYEDDPTCNQE